MLTARSEETASCSKTVGLEVKCAVGGRLLEGSEISLLDLESTDEQDLVFDASRLKKVTELEMMDIDASWDDVWVGIDMLHSASHAD